MALFNILAHTFFRHWHLVYPGQGPAEIVNKDRRGELFYYMHNQIISRYNVERFCNKLPRVVDLANLRVALPEAYFPKMIRGSNNRAYPGRYENTLLRDMNRSEGVVSLGGKIFYSNISKLEFKEESSY